MQELVDVLGFMVEDGQVKTQAVRKDSFDQVVPVGVRPATPNEIAMWALLTGYHQILEEHANE